MKYASNFKVALIVVGAIAAIQTALSFSLPLLALEISGKGTGLALIKGAGFIPNILFAVFIGVINDRMIKATAFRRYISGLAITVGLLFLAMLSDRVSLLGLMVFMIVFNGIAYALNNAQMTLIRLSVSKSRLADATALTSTVHSVITTTGPAVAGFALLQFGHTGLIGVCLVILAGATIMARMLHPSEKLPTQQPFWQSMQEGWQVFTANRELVMMTVVIVLTNAAEGAFITALILKMKTVVGLNDFQIGIVLAAAGFGAVIASRIAAPARRLLGYRTAFFWPIWILAALYILMIVTWPFWVLCLLSFLEGGISLLFAIGVWSYRQESTQAQHMGRVAGLTGAIFKIGMPPVIILAGILADTSNLTSTFILAAAINVVAALFLVYVARWGWPLKK
ncbi:MAG: MFS transporter [Paracoccaceae bacterium]